jgi:MFS family permease
MDVTHPRISTTLLNMSQPTTKFMKLGFLWFTPGVTGINLATMFFAGFGTMAMISFMSFIQPYVLTEILHVPTASQGSLTGNLHAFQEVIFIALAGLVGAMSDKQGRPKIYAVGFIFVALGYGLYPLASSIEQLYLIRGLFALGVAGVSIMLSACIVDYIQERSRGRWVGIISIFNGLGILLMSFLLSKLPAIYKNAGADEIMAGRYAFWTVASICLAVAVVLYVGLFKGGNKDVEAEPLLKQFSVGLKLGLKNPRLAIAYGGAFIGRGDFAVIGTFFSLWLTQEGMQQGMTAAEALATAGPLFGMIQLCAMVWAPIMGLISDRLERITAVALGLAIAGSGYLLMSQVSDPFSSEIYPAMVLLGMGETSVIVSVGALIGQEATGKYRGSIVGVFGQFGGFGILATTLIGGYLFDGIGRTAPFVMMGLFNLALLVAVLYVRATDNGPAAAE